LIDELSSALAPRFIGEGIRLFEGIVRRRLARRSLGTVEDIVGFQSSGDLFLKRHSIGM
jgi:hypothetical protein